MAFIVEDGTSVTDANSYCDILFSDNYFEERFNTTWLALTDERKQSLLILATDYIEMRFGLQFKGVRYLTGQSLSFPMVTLDGLPMDTFIYDVIDPTLVTGVIIPTAIKRATCEYAIRALTAPLVNDLASDAIISRRVKIGQIEKEENFTGSSKRPEKFSSYPSADMLVKPYLRPISGVVIR